MSDADRRWLDDQHPHGEAHSLAQIETLIGLLGRPPKCVVDLGCGIGRALVPLAQAGHEAVGVDSDARALERCAAALHEAGTRAGLVKADFRAPWPSSLSGADAVCCLGNTFMMLAEVDEAVAVLAHAARAMNPDGLFVMDDCAGEYWSELTGGNWQSGISEDGPTQLVRARDDAVFALRHGDDVDETRWTIGPSDTPLRLWTDGALRLAGRAAGLSGPDSTPGGGLVVMRPVAQGIGRDSSG